MVDAYNIWLIDLLIDECCSVCLVMLVIIDAEGLAWLSYLLHVFNNFFVKRVVRPRYKFVLCFAVQNPET